MATKTLRRVVAVFSNYIHTDHSSLVWGQSMTDLRTWFDVCTAAAAFELCGRMISSYGFTLEYVEKNVVFATVEVEWEAP